MMKRFFIFLFASLALCFALGRNTPAYAADMADQENSISVEEEGLSVKESVPTKENFPAEEELLHDDTSDFVLNTDSLTLTPGDEESLTARRKQKDVTGKVMWITSDKAVAKVQDGKVTAVAFGICTITAKTSDGQKASCSVFVTPEKAVFRSVKKRSAGKVSISWRTISGATGYQLYRATSKEGTYSKVKTFSDAGTTSCINTVTRNKKYYYKIRAYYKTSDGTYLYSVWSDIKSVSM